MKRLVLFLFVPLAIVLFAVSSYFSGGRYISTENAYIRANIAMVSPSVSGHVKQVLVSDNQQVKIGEVLFILDREPFDNAVHQAAAMLASARDDIAQLKANYQQKNAQLAAAKIKRQYAQNERDRVAQLSNNIVLSAEKIAARDYALSVADSNVNTAKTDVAITLAQLGGDPDLQIDHYPRVKLAQHRMAKAELDRRWATIKAGIDGTVVKLVLQPGEYVRQSQALFSIVQTDALWIEANLKETQLTHIQVGQSAHISVDAFPELAIAATVSSISPASGSEFAILPPQNATGNWVKITQRIPIKLSFSDAKNLPQLRAGMSVEVEIDTQHQRQLPKFLSFN